jgi:hypothetical protein
MPIAKIQTPDGKTMTLEVPEGATEQQIMEFAQANYKPSQQVAEQPVTPRPQQEKSFMDKALGVGDAALAVGSGIASDIYGGLGGLTSPINPFVDDGTPADVALRLKEQATYNPRTEVGKNILSSVGEFVQPIADVANKVTKGIGNFGQETATALGASPEVAGATGAILETAPTALMEYFGFKGLRASTKAAVKSAPSNVKAMVKEAAPTIEQLKAKSSQLYDQLDQSTAKIKPQIYNKIVESVSKDVGSINPKLYPKSAGAFEELQKGLGEAKTFKQLNELRQITADAAFNVMDKADARIGKIMLEKVDYALDKLSDSIGGDAKGARELWKRAKKADTIANMVENASLAASGLENGLRIQARKILGSERKSRGFSKSELSALRELEQGSTAANAAKFLGKFGVTEGKATSMVGAGFSGAAGFALGGPVGAASAMTLGQTAKMLAQKLTSNKAKFVDEITRAGTNGRDITQAYLRNTTKANRSVSDLTQLLLDPKVDISSIEKISMPSKIVDDAVFFAKQMRDNAKIAGNAGVIATPALTEEETK